MIKNRGKFIIPISIFNWTLATDNNGLLDFVLHLSYLFYYIQLKELTPQVSHVAKILLDYGKHSPGDVPAVSVHFESMRDGWKDKMQALTNLVDSATDTGKFIEACGMYHVISFSSGVIVVVFH